VSIEGLNVLTINHERRPTMDNSWARNFAICCTAMAWLGVPFAAQAATSDAAATALLTKYGCQACHTVDKKLVGPAYKEVAAKYAGDAGAAAKLEQKIKSGGSGVWGQIPMPPNNVPDADLKTLVAWILAQK
jgi:cytochrome c